MILQGQVPAIQVLLPLGPQIMAVILLIVEQVSVVPVPQNMGSYHRSVRRGDPAYFAKVGVGLVAPFSDEFRRFESAVNFGSLAWVWWRHTSDSGTNCGSSSTFHKSGFSTSQS